MITEGQGCTQAPLKFPSFKRFCCQYPLINYFVSDSENMVNESKLAKVETGNELVEIHTMFCEIKALITDLQEKKD